MSRIPIATYRLQFNARFTFQDARRIAKYLSHLGISDVYASPILRPRKGSEHGYDIVDPSALNPELGTEEDFDALHRELQKRGLGFVLDIVPNHLAASHENAWWMSVLENGLQSRFLHYFDIDWRDNKVLLPILGHPYGETLESRRISLGFDAEGFFFTYYDKRLPFAPGSYHLVLRECIDALPDGGVAVELRDLVQNDAVIANSRFLKDTLWRIHEQSPEFRGALASVIARINGDADALDRVLSAQCYRLAYWRIASETINYRRFFDVTDLVGLKVENPEVFEARNRRIFDLMAEGKVTGLRIDHIDGLFDPYNYLTKLQLRFSPLSPPSGERVRVRGSYIVVEKILAPNETLCPSFPVAGTTGYDFLDIVNALFVDPNGLAQLTDFYRTYTGITTPFDDLVYERKKQVIEQLFSGEMRALGLHLGALAVADRNARDFAPSELQAALLEITACLPVYRTYMREGQVSESDRAFIARAIGEARRRARANVDARLFDFLELVLRLEPPAYIAAEREKWTAFVMRWQQFTGRVMAKGVEDTAFYNYNRLVSLNEVGGEPGRTQFDPVAELHARNERIARDWPHTMNATSTHDTKRSEDVRARIDVLSEIPDVWQREVARWTRMNAPLKRDGVPHPNEELLIYQTLAGVFDSAGVAERLRAYLEKAAREAKTHTSWITPNAEYESALKDFATRLLEHEPFVNVFRRFHRRIAFHGFLNSLAQLVLKVCSPGVPDFYQGTELWDYTLVDPDNRRPIDYEHRVALLKRKFRPPATLLRHWPDGRIKLFVTARSLATRARHIESFQGAYRAVDTGTPNAVAFLRGDDVLVVTPRLTTQLGNALPLGDVWRDHRLAIDGRWQNAFTGEVMEDLALRNVFASFPVAILERA
ncbi:MAG TPA: malto-oligosyltrehalose synthase [Thermoanaerobaculia bacterium]|nr:malto-oligosyltrehalose synthase [Thermoanaerobaculia bacterium]